MTYTRPIGFSTPMIKALIAGRKTQTRRLVTPMWSKLKAKFLEGEQCWLWVREKFFDTAREAFESLWNQLHSRPGTTWADNPRVIAFTFEVHQRNIDAEAGS